MPWLQKYNKYSKGRGLFSKNIFPKSMVEYSRCYKRLLVSFLMVYSIIFWRSSSKMVLQIVFGACEFCEFESGFILQRN